MNSAKYMLKQYIKCTGKLGVERYFKTFSKLDERDSSYYLQWM